MSAPVSMEDELRMRAKRELRKRLRSVRSALPASAIAERSAALCARVLALPEWNNASTVALFRSMGDEVQTAALESAALSAGKRVAYPVVTEAPALVFRVPDPKRGNAAFAASHFGVEEPTEDAPELPLEEVDFVLVPALGIASNGHRLGYGAGWYDRTLPRMSRAVRVAVAFDFQLLVEVPTRAGDEPVHWIITDQRTLRAGAS